MKKLKKHLILLMIALVTLSGCGVSNKLKENSELGKGFPVTVQDDYGYEVTLDNAPERIISLVPAATETLFAIDVGSKVIACSQWDNYPVDVQSKVEYIFDDPLNPNSEQIIALNPDLIVLGDIGQEKVKAIQDLGIPCYVYNPNNLEETYEGIKKLGIITGNSTNAEKTVEEMKTMENDITDKVAAIKENERIKVWLEVDATLFTAGKNTFINELINKAGGINIGEAGEGWFQMSEEQVIEENPQVILVTYGYYDPNAVSNILQRKAWQNVDAVKNHKVIEVDNDTVTRQGPRIIEGLKSICEALYPQLFK